VRITRRAALTILSTWLMLLSISVFAGVWWDDFEDGRADGWSEVSGDWEMQMSCAHLAEWVSYLSPPVMQMRIRTRWRSRL